MIPCFCRPPAVRLAWLIVLALLLVGCGSSGDRVQRSYLASHQQELMQPASFDDTPMRFTIESGTPARTVGSNLLAAGLIRDEALFEAYLRVNGLDSRLAAGTFVLNPAMSIVEIVDALQDPRASTIVVTIPEGWRSEQIADHLAQRDIFGDQDLETPKAADGDNGQNGTKPGAISSSSQAERYADIGLSGDLSGLDPSRYPFLQERPAAAGLDGYLFPDTYELAAADTRAEALLTRQLDAFAARVLPLYEEAIASGATTLDLHSVLTVASIVEREAVVAEERPAIAGVYLNRLVNGIKLEADPTVQYAMGYQPGTGQWWKTPVYLEEYSSVDSPYNTYLYPGLPPSPIANPGLASIRAVLFPENHGYLYFVALPDGSGAHVFARTFDEHRINVQRYLSGE